MKLTIQTNLNGCQVYIYDNKLRLVPVIIKSTSYSGGNSLLHRRFIIEPTSWSTVKEFYIGRSVQIGTSLETITEDNADSKLATYLNYNYAATNVSEESRYADINWSMPRQVDFGDAFTAITSVTDILKFIFNEVMRDTNGRVIRVTDAEATKLRIRDLLGEDAWLEVFKLTSTEYKTIETELVAKILSTMGYAESLYNTLMKYYLATSGQTAADSNYRELIADKQKLTDCIANLNREF